MPSFLAIALSLNPVELIELPTQRLFLGASDGYWAGFPKGQLRNSHLLLRNRFFLWRYPLDKFNIDYYWNLRNQWCADHKTSKQVNLADLPTQRLILGSSNMSWEENPRGQRRYFHLLPSYLIFSQDPPQKTPFEVKWILKLICIQISMIIFALSTYSYWAILSYNR